ncbi:MAG TPA: adenylate/guanylate cyclase domain-containing protein [Candidatus Limnocylindria bacterium]|nr:adenylate/guanylate cyclase domain-containing protein [Candidatus Limnocylindria bacterium]
MRRRAWIAPLLLIALAPLAVLAWLLSSPNANEPWIIPTEHLVVTANVSIVALLVAILTARAASQVRHYPTLLVAVGFMSMAGLFAVHGLSTPGVIQRDEKAGDAGLVVGMSAQLALFVAALFFAARYSPLARWLERRVAPRVLVAAAVLGVAAYAVAAIGWPSAFGGVARWMLVTGGASYDYDPSGYGYGGYRAPDLLGGAGIVPYVLTAGVVLLYGVAAVRQGADYARTRLPLQGALAAAFLFLAQAQVSQFLGPTWTPSWWEYHVLMAIATFLALGALFLELDRRRGLERFLPPTVVERVIQGDPLRLEGERQTVTIMFADLRGSTALAERLGPEEIVDVLNTYLRVMATCVLDAGGILDKFLGDGLMAIFGAMGDRAHGAPAAMRAALDMRARITALNEQRTARGDPVVRFGVGVHTGDVVLGAVGLPERSDYTAIGDTVNTASRMESLTKEFHVDAVVSEQTAEHLDGGRAALAPLGDAQVRGKSATVRVFTLR